MDSLTSMPPDAQPIPDDLRAQLLAPFVEGVTTALREGANTEACERMAYRARLGRAKDMVASLEISAAMARRLALGVDAATATTLAHRMLNETLANPDDALIRDCLGELANVAAGQAKALLHGTPHAFAFGTPQITTGDLSSDGIEDCLIAVLSTDAGDVAVELFVQP
jgi:CheY-specific phosphatase CheX